MTTDGTNEQPSSLYVLLCNLSMEGNEYHIGESLILRRIPFPISVFDLASVGASGFREWALLEPLAPTLTTEIVSPKDAVRSPGYDAINKCWLASALLVLRGFVNHMCPAVSSYSWAMVAGHQKSKSTIFRRQLMEEGPKEAVHNPRHPLPPFEGGLLDYHTQVWVPSNMEREVFHDSDAVWMEKKFQKFNDIAASSERFRYALEAAIDWRFAKERRSAIARIWSGIEALFEVSSELSFRIPLYASTVIAERGNERLIAFKKMRKLYGIRSKAVHGEPLKETQIESGIDESFTLLRDLLLISVERGKVPSTEDFLNDLLV